LTTFWQPVILDGHIFSCLSCHDATDCFGSTACNCHVLWIELQKAMFYQICSNFNTLKIVSLFNCVQCSFVSAVSYNPVACRGVMQFIGKPRYREHKLKFALEILLADQSIQKIV